jgi:hypothetical protein
MDATALQQQQHEQTAAAKTSAKIAMKSIGSNNLFT